MQSRFLLLVAHSWGVSVSFSSLFPAPGDPVPLIQSIPETLQASSKMTVSGLGTSP